MLQRTAGTWFASTDRCGRPPLNTALDPMHVTLRNGSYLVAFAALVVGSLHWVSHMRAVGSCMDRGGVFDYSSLLCRHDVEHLPPVSYVERFWPILVLLVALAVAALLIGHILGRARRHGI